MESKCLDSLCKPIANLCNAAPLSLLLSLKRPVKARQVKKAEGLQPAVPIHRRNSRAHRTTKRVRGPRDKLAAKRSSSCSHNCEFPAGEGREALWWSTMRCDDSQIQLIEWDRSITKIDDSSSVATHVARNIGDTHISPCRLNFFSSRI